MDNPFLNAQKQLENVAKYLDISSDILEILKNPQRILEVNIPVRMDSGGIRVFRGFRAQHNNALGPYKGGVRFHPNVSKEEVIALSMWMSWKCAVAGIPFGGGKGGVIVDPKLLSEGELEKLSRGYVRAIAPIIGAKIDVPAPDVGTNGKIMNFMIREIRDLRGVGGFEENEILATFTGKPVENGGSLGREEATGRGGVYVLQALLTKLNPKSEYRHRRWRDPVCKRENPKQYQNSNDKSSKQGFEFRASNLEFPQSVRIAVQGFGNVGFWFAKLAQEAGFEIVAISDSKGGVMGDLRDLGGLREYKEKTGSVIGFPGTKTIINEELLELEIDVLVPAALENVITKENADRIKAKVIVEMANGPTTPEADEILSAKQTIIIPDILANSGGVTVSYFEWEQNMRGEKWDEKSVNEKLEKTIVGALGEVREMGERKKVDLRKAAYILAVDKIVKAMLK